VYIPKFYLKYAYNTGVHSWMVNDTLESGYEVHPAFVVDGAEVDFITIGAFEGWQDGQGTPKLYSVAGKLPSVNLTRAQFRTMAQARTSAHTQLLYYQYWALQVLYITYFGNFDSQAVIGKAMTYFGSGGASAFGLGTVNDGSYAVTKTGISLKNGVKTAGEYVDVNDPSAYMSMFGIENLWGNLLKFVDGINVEQLSAKIYLCNNPSDLADDTSTGYVDMGITYNAIEGYPATLFNTKKGIIAATVTEGTPLIPDYQGLYSAAEETWVVVVSGGCYVDGAGTGVALLDAYDGSSNANTNFGARLCFSGVISAPQ